MKKKYTLFRADGDVISTADFQGEAGLKSLEQINTTVQSVRVMQKKATDVAVVTGLSKTSIFESVTRETRAAFKILQKLLPAAWLANAGAELPSQFGMKDNEMCIRFRSADKAGEFAGRLKAAKALYKKVKEQGTTTVDPRYSGQGAELSCKVGGHTVTFLQPFDQKAFEAQQQHTLQKADTDSKVAAVQVQQAEAQQQQAEADLKTEEARNATATGRTLRIVGLCALAALVVAVVVVVIVKTKKK